MSLQIRDLGRNNRIEVNPAVEASSSGTITLDGDDSHLVLSSGSSLTGGTVHLGSRACVMINGSQLSSSEIYCASDASVLIGEGCAFTWRTQVLAHEAGSISIGADCLFSTETLVTSSDMHSITELASGLRLNPARDVRIGTHVWIGFRAIILKGSTIGSGAVIGAGAIVTGDIPENCVATGNPARVQRRAVAWRNDLI